MKKYIIAIMLVLLLPTVGYAKCCDCCQDKSYITYGTMTMRGYAYGSKSLNDRSFMGDHGTMTMRGYYAYGSKSLNGTGIKKLIGKMVYRTNPCESINDRSFMGDPRKLLAVTDNYLILSSDILASGQIEIDRDIWDDGNWEEVKAKRLTVTEQLIRTEAYHKRHHGLSKWQCTRCGKSLKYNPVGYYCTSCKTEFNIKED